MANNIKTVMTYDLDGTITDFNIPFEYLARKFVVVTLIGADRKVLVLNTDYRFVTKTTISTTKAWGPADGYQQIEVRRYTSATERLVDFTDGSILRAYDLNISQVQTLHVAEEARDLTADTIGVNNDGYLDARGRKIVNVADATEAGDAVSFGQMQRFDGSAYNSMLKAKTSEDNSKVSETNSAASALISENEADRAKTEADRTTGKADEAAASALSASGSAMAASGSATAASGSASAAASKAAEAKGYADRLDDFTTLQDRINSVAVSQVGDVEPHVSRLVAKPGTVYGDGQLLSRSVYPTLWAKVDAGEVPVVDEAVWQSTPGKRGAYTKGTDGSNFRVPDYNGVTAGSVKAPVLRGDGGINNSTGDIMLSGVPNPYGRIDARAGASYGFFADDVSLVEGSLFLEGKGSKAGLASDPGTGWGFSAIVIDPSARYPVYQNGLDEARMNSVVICWVIRTHGVVNNPGSVDAAVLASRVEQIYTEVITHMKSGQRYLRNVFSGVTSTTQLSVGRTITLSEPCIGKMLDIGVHSVSLDTNSQVYKCHPFLMPPVGNRMHLSLWAWTYELEFPSENQITLVSTSGGPQPINYIDVICDYPQ